MKRLRCCGRFCFWKVPLGPWCCTRCVRKFYYDQCGPIADVPKAHLARFWEAIDELLAMIEKGRP
jgi:hypothetical protein